MRFLLLGPLEAVADGRPVVLGGAKQRLALAFLLFHHNRLVSVKELMDALWSDKTPTSARKMLHNAVCGLRKMLSVGENSPSPLLLTRSPGYLLQVPAENLDLVRFEELASHGHAELAAGSWEHAAELFREALRIWRGPVLSDLVDEGIDWPEITLVSNARLTALEGRIEADLHLGRHHEVLCELEALVERQPQRERLCAQLMRLLYLRGRQADALTAYRRTRDALVDQLGLDPSPELRELEHAILTHSPSVLAGIPAVPRPRSGGAAAAAAWGPREAGRAPGEVEPRVQNSDGCVFEETRQASVVVAVATPAPGYSAAKADLELVHAHVSAVIEQESRIWEARVLGNEHNAVEPTVRKLLDAAAARWPVPIDERVAPLWLADVRGRPDSDEHAPWCAVQMACGLLSRCSAEPGLRTAGGGRSPFTIHVAVVTGEAWTRQGPGAGEFRLRLAEQTAEMCRYLLEDETAGPVQVCPTTAEAIAPPDCLNDLPFVGREREFAVLDGCLAAAVACRQPHLVTVFSGFGQGRSRFLAEWVDRLRRKTSGFAVDCLVAGTPPPANGAVKTAPLADLVRAAAGASVGAAIEGLARTVSEVVDEGKRPWVLAHLNKLIVPGGADSPVTPDAFDALAYFFESLASRRPLVLVVDDLHWADNGVLDFLDQLVDRVGGIPLVVIAASRPDLLSRRSGWGGGKLRATSLFLEPLPDDDMSRILRNAYDHVRDQAGSDRWPTGPDAWPAAAAALGGIPLCAVEYGRLLAEMPGDSPDIGLLLRDRIPIPYAVRAKFELFFDTLPQATRAVLYDAALFCDQVPGEELALLALSGGYRLAGQRLRLLEQLGVLRRVVASSDYLRSTYAFASLPMRLLAYGRVPQAVRARKEQLIQVNRNLRRNETTCLADATAERESPCGHLVVGGGGSHFGARTVPDESGRPHPIGASPKGGIVPVSYQDFMTVRSASLPPFPLWSAN